jgi:glycosyltransferase involved in cell wall biosynthesis
MIEKYNLICFSFMPWSNMWKRNQSMMAEIARFEFIDKVIFVNPYISLWQILKQHWSNGARSFSEHFFPPQIHSNIWSYTLLYALPVSYQTQCIEKMESRRHLKQLRRLNGQRPFILFMNCPNIFYPHPLDELLKSAALSIFDFSDDFVELVHSKKGKELYLHNNEKYARAADVVLTVNDHLKKKYAHLNSNIHVIKNATNYANFQKETYAVVPFLEKLKRNNKPIIGYSGISNVTRIDVEILDYLFSNRPDWQIVFVGTMSEDLIVRFSKYDNFFHLPAVPYEQLPDHLSYFQVTMVPFLVNDHTRGNNLLKFHDYLAMGKPVVTTNIGGAEDLRDVIRIADTPDTFLAQIEGALAEGSQQLIENRKKVAYENSWPNRIKELKNILINELHLRCDSQNDEKAGYAQSQCNYPHP